ncbi:hypothetical protein A2955_01735 [Candidatus Woesebacteria bacterium RIFCSPLOWO2_01_FULL_37_19]|uniref:Uncharacterized protein n=2 Tax=Candidatus Woeseibacteriota TaxID=1752722 RepID=A0A1F8BBB7_9BACT|nr:MAG: hypothetical protein A2955_01735 [Candidatus Woesebacteria bacterium RIFCSPLOWO2_01_FULL_37_19]
MYYKESKLIFEEIKKAKKILLNCHRSPDPDSVASNLALYQVLKHFGKEIKIISSDDIQKNLLFLQSTEKIDKVDMLNFDYSSYDLFIVLDSSSLDQAIGIKSPKLPEIPLIIIDHHVTNENYGKINLVDHVSSTCEVLYKMFTDWDVKFTPQLATILLTGIYSDTVSYQTPNTGVDTFFISSELLRLGADKDKIVLNLFHSYDFKLVKFWGEMLDRMRIDEEHYFVWVAIPFEVFSDFGKPKEAKSLAANIIFRTIKDTRFCIVMVEQKRGIMNLSFRTRYDFDVSKIAQELGGSGHTTSAGAWFEFENFDKAVEKVLNVARKYAKEYKKV